MADLEVLPFAPTSFDGQVCVPLASTGARSWFESDAETAALEWAAGEVGPNQSQVSLTAHHAPDIAGTFAVRHLTWHPDGVRDSGWRCWVAGAFVGGVTP